MPAVVRPPPSLLPIEKNNKKKIRSLHIDATPVPQPMHVVVDDSAPSSALTEDHSDAESVSLITPAKPRSLRNQKKLSLILPSAHSNASTSSLSGFPESPRSIAPPSSAVARRRASVASLPNSNSVSRLYRKEEDCTTSPSAPYSDGPIQLLPGVWIGSEEHARDWQLLLERGIRSILNVAKEVAPPYVSQSDQQLRPTVSTPNFATSFAERADPTYVPPHGPSGRPALRYLKLPWSHGQPDLVRDGFVEGMKFVDAALARGDGVLVHCQLGVSRSATMVIALVMRAAHSNSPDYPADVLALKSGGMHAAYDYCKQRSKWIGPNMSLMYQLLEYERALGRGSRSNAGSRAASPTPSDRSSLIAAEEAEWGRRRSALDHNSEDEGEDDPEAAEVNERESLAMSREARALDFEMEQRMVARRRTPSTSSNTSSTGLGMGAAWKSRYGHGHGVRSRAGSIASNVTSQSVLSEDPMEEDEDRIVTDSPEDNWSSSRSTQAVDDSPESLNVPWRARKDAFTPRTARPLGVTAIPPSAPAYKLSFGIEPPPSASHMKTGFGHMQPPPSAPAFKQSFALSAPPKPKKRRPAPLLPPVPPSPDAISYGGSSTASASELPASPASAPKRKPSRPIPAPLKLNLPSRSSSRASSRAQPSPRVALHTPSTSTLFMFPAEKTAALNIANGAGPQTPSTMTLSSVPFPNWTPSTPRVSTVRKDGGKRRSFIDCGIPPTPTTACSIVDARGFVA